MNISNQFLREISLNLEKITDLSNYPFHLPVIQSLTSPVKFHPKVTFFVGENGSGKSTLLEAIAGALGFNSEGGSKNFNFSTTNENQDLAKSLRLVRGTKRPQDGFFYRADSFYNVASEIDRLGVGDSYGQHSLHARSHGEGFLDLVANRMRGNGIYLFDEPEAALSPKRQLSLLSHMHLLAESGSQLIIATHSPIIMAYPDAQIYSFDSGKITPASYEDTEHFQITKSFLTRRSQMLTELLRNE